MATVKVTPKKKPSIKVVPMKPLKRKDVRKAA